MLSITAIAGIVRLFFSILEEEGIILVSELNPSTNIDKSALMSDAITLFIFHPPPEPN